MNRQIVRAALVAFLISRAIIFVLLVALSQVAFLQKIYSGSVWETRIDLDAARVRPGLTQQVLIGDAWWYRSIAIDGYRDSEPWPARGKAAFFPLFPLLVRFLGLSGDFAIDGALISNLSLLAGLIILGHIVSKAGLAAEDAERAIFYMAFFPTSYFFSLPLTESLFLLCTAAAYLAAMSGRWWMGGTFGALAALTRVNGLLLAPVLLIIAWQQYRRWNVRMLWILLVPAGTGLYMLHSYRTLGNAMAFVGAQEQWGRVPGGFWRPLVAYLARPDVVSDGWNLLAFNSVVAVALLAAAVALFLRRAWPLGVYTLLSVLLPLSSGSLQSMSRYALVVFPLFVWLAILGRARWGDRLITAVNLTLFGAFLVLFALRVDFALA